MVWGPLTLNLKMFPLKVMSDRNEDKLTSFKCKVTDIPFKQVGKRSPRARIDWKVEVSKNSLCAPMFLLPILNPGSQTRGKPCTPDL